VCESDQIGLAETFAGIARRLQTENSPQKMQIRVTEAAVTSIAGCDHAAISVIWRRGDVETVAATDEVGPRVDAIQYETGQGPCLDSIAEHEVCLIDDLADDERWPAFSNRTVRETGVLSMLSFRLFVQADTIGALNLYSRHPAAFDQHGRVVGSVLAAHAAIALSAAREHERAENLEEALRTSREIGMAMGVLMGHNKITEEQAFQLLRQASQNLNRKLRDIAADVVKTGELPECPRSRHHE
jgi:transcriptional regulator with GAF, ATPase, and Fis domain